MSCFRTISSSVTILFEPVQLFRRPKATEDRPFALGRFTSYHVGAVSSSSSTSGKYMDLVEFMLAHGADVNKQDHRGNTCIMMAAGCANEAVLL
jgi:ankyrin repeat protein